MKNMDEQIIKRYLVKKENVMECLIKEISKLEIELENNKEVIESLKFYKIVIENLMIDKKEEINRVCKKQFNTNVNYLVHSEEGIVLVFSKGFFVIKSEDVTVFLKTDFEKWQSENKEFSLRLVS